MIDAELQLCALRSLWLKITGRLAGGWFWAWGIYGANWDEEGKYWIFGLGPVSLVAYNSLLRGHVWHLSCNLD